MRIATVKLDGERQAAILTSASRVVPVGKLLGRSPMTVLDVIDSGRATLDRLADPGLDGVPAEDVEFLAPIPRTRRNVFCVGWNYSEHFEEGRLVRTAGAPMEIPDAPTFFSKNPATIVGPNAPVWHPAPYSTELDWEVELAVVIGRAGSDIEETSAMDHVFGYTVANDVSVRDHQRRHGGQWFKGKNFDSHLPLGPWVVTADEIANPHRLRITSRINGVTKQDSSTRHMVFTLPRIIHELSMGLTLEPGDVILTGTPEGVGFARKPPEFLRPGDEMEMEIEGIGLLRNPVVAPDRTPASAHRR